MASWALDAVWYGFPSMLTLVSLKDSNEPLGSYFEASTDSLTHWNQMRQIETDLGWGDHLFEVKCWEEAAEYDDWHSAPGAASPNVDPWLPDVWHGPTPGVRQCRKPLLIYMELLIYVEHNYSVYDTDSL